MTIHSTIKTSMQSNKKLFALLIDPDDVNESKVNHLLQLTRTTNVDFFFIGGSLITKTNFSSVILQLKEQTNIPVVIFPGSLYQIDNNADAILLLTLISGRNPDYLIGQHVQAAPYLKKSNLEIISTGYMLIDGENKSAVQYISNTTPIPRDKNDIAVCTALAGEMLGNGIIYMDSGSGAHYPVSPDMITDVKSQITSPLIVGGGIRTPDQMKNAYTAGADVVVVGNAIEKNPSLLNEFSEVANSFSLGANS